VLPAVSLDPGNLESGDAEVFLEPGQFADKELRPMAARMKYGLPSARWSKAKRTTSGLIRGKAVRWPECLGIGVTSLLAVPELY